jgi:hypothetical protein
VTQLVYVIRRRNRVGSTPASYVGGPGFKSRPGYWRSSFPPGVVGRYLRLITPVLFAVLHATRINYKLQNSLKKHKQK